MEVTLVTGLIIFALGLLVGFINTLSGSGSLITLPLLIFLGLDAGVANGTNRIAILLQTLVGIFTFKKEKVLDSKPALKLSGPVILGAIPGAYIATQLPSVHFEKVLGVIFVLMVLVMLLTPGNWNKEFRPASNLIIRPLHYVLFFFIGAYGGFIQAGVGIFILFALVLGPGFDLVRANALKLFLTFIFTPLALLIFYHHNQIDWTVGMILAGGNMIGAYVAAKMAIKSGAKFIKWLVIIMVLFSAIQFLFFRS